jgi:hypothetical protein
MTADRAKGGRRAGAGIFALGAFFAVGAAIAAVTAVALLTPGGFLEPIWRLNPDAHDRLRAMGPWAVPLMAVVALACLLSAIGLWRRARWGHHLAVALLAANLVGDLANALARGDLRTLIGLPVAGALLAYLLSAGVRAQFLGTRAG